jgi:hypothetical protein
VYPCRVCEQTNGKRREKNEGINSENVYKKNEQNGTNTRIDPMRHKNRERERERERQTKKTEDVV